MTRGEQVNPAVLVWARESAGLDLKDAAKQIGLASSSSASSESKLAELERGTRLPSRTQLSKIAKTYRRPLLTFYMSTPPRRGERGSDFRFTGRSVSDRDNALLDALLRDIKARQEMVKSLLEDENEAESRSFVGSCALTDGVDAVAGRVASALELSPDGKGRPSDANELFKFLRTKVESLGVFVLLIGDLGSYHSSLSEDVFRGFTLADKIAPFIVINDNDAKPAHSFTLLHELTHIYLGQSGISGPPESVRESTEVGRIEQFCNDVAGMVLLPENFAHQSLARFGSDNKAAAMRFISGTARQWGVSEPLVAFRLLRLERISSSLYQELNSDFGKRWQSHKASVKSANQLRDGGPNYYVVRQYSLGNALVDVVRRTLREDRLTHTKAAKVLGVKPGSVESLIRKYEGSVASLTYKVAR